MDLLGHGGHSALLAHVRLLRSLHTHHIRVTQSTQAQKEDHCLVCIDDERERVGVVVNSRQQHDKEQGHQVRRHLHRAQRLLSATQLADERSLRVRLLFHVRLRLSLRHHRDALPSALRSHLLRQLLAELHFQAGVHTHVSAALSIIQTLIICVINVGIYKFICVVENEPRRRRRRMCIFIFVMCCDNKIIM